MVYKVFVDGQEGTTGLQIHQYLARRSDLEVLRIAADKRKDAQERSRLFEQADVVFLCLPDAAAREAVTLVRREDTCLIDASTAHRIAPGWVYGLPELAPGQRDALRRANRIANPGCHASAFILLLRPLIDAGVLPADYPVSATSITGYSGGGKKMIEQYQAGGDAVLTAPRQYGLALGHKHLPEMQAYARLGTAPVFAPVVANYYKGLAVSIGLHTRLLTGRASPARVHEALERHYEGERFVTVRPLNDPEVSSGGFFDVQACNDSNRAELFVFGHEEQVMLIARLDNLGKGASGAAVQAMNLRLGLDEGLGLEQAEPLTAAA